MEILAILLILLLSYIIFKKPFLGILFAIFFATLGELGRIPESIGPEYLINDLFLPFLIFIFLLKKLSCDRKFKIPPLLPIAAIWIVIAAFSLLLNSTWLEAGELAESTLYLVRFVEYFFLYLIACDEIQKNHKNWSRILAGILSGAVLISIFGFIQLKIYPSFFELGMQDHGWDPHIGRLLSTWFDPNFVGGLLAFITCILFGIALNYKKLWKNHIKLGIFSALSLIILSALYLTYSRSTYLACLIGILVITGIKSRKYLLYALLGGGVLFAILAQTQDRFMDLWESFQSILGLNEYASLFNPDATSRLRIDSWQNAIAVIKEHFWFGSGYNTFKYAQWKLGLIQDLELHQATGSDSSILTIFATTGIFGIITYLWLYIKAFLENFQKTSSFQQAYNYGLGGGLVTLLFHSTFVNSLLFPHILVFFWISLALSAKISPKVKKHR